MGLMRSSAVVALALVVTVPGTDAALDGVLAAFAGMQFLGLCQGVWRLEAHFGDVTVLWIECLPRLRLAIVLMLGLQQPTGVG